MHAHGPEGSERECVLWQAYPPATQTQIAQSLARGERGLVTRHGHERVHLDFAARLHRTPGGAEPMRCNLQTMFQHLCVRARGGAGRPGSFGSPSISPQTPAIGWRPMKVQCPGGFARSILHGPPEVFGGRGVAMHFFASSSGSNDLLVAVHSTFHPFGFSKPQVEKGCRFASQMETSGSAACVTHRRCPSWPAVGRAIGRGEG